MPAPLSLTRLPAGLLALRQWREALCGELDGIVHLLADAELLGPSAVAAAQALSQRLQADSAVVAVVGDAARGKSELINALFFADAGQRLLPAGEGGCTACAVELGWQAGQPAALALLPIATRRQAARLADWRARQQEWERRELEGADIPAAANALAELSHTRPVSRRRAASLGMLPSGSFASLAQVEVPLWRHALFNYPHPLLRQGLVVIDTPGLGTVCLEPELALGLLPGADLMLFVADADPAAAPADEELWSAYLRGRGLNCLVVLNKIDTLRAAAPGATAAPAATPAAASDEASDEANDETRAEARATLAERRCAETAAALGLPRERVLPVSAGEALTACGQGDVPGLAASGMAALERAVTEQLVEQRRKALASDLVSAVFSLLEEAKRRLREQRRSHAEQMLGLRGLRSESNDRFSQLQARLQGDRDELQQCASQLDALRTVQAKAHALAMRALDAEHVRSAATELQTTLGSSLLRAPSRASAFAALCERLRGHIQEASQRCAETAATWQASFEQINAQFGSFLALPPQPDLTPYGAELDLIERGYSRYFGLGQAVRMPTPASAEPLRRMLVAKLRLVFEDARHALAAGHQAVIEMLQEQLGERRQQLQRRQDALERIQRAAGELAQHLLELEAQDGHLLDRMDRAQQLAAALRERAARGPHEAGAPLGQEMMATAE